MSSTNHPTRAQLAALKRRDPRLARAMSGCERFPGFPSPAQRRVTHYAYLARAILFQQLTSKAATTIHRRACALTPGATFPSAEELGHVPDAALRAAGVSGSKVASLRDLGARVLDGRLVLRGIGRLPDEQITERLVQVRGIGVWSAQMFLLFKLGRLDVLPATDLGVQEGLRRLDGLEQRPGPRELAERGECWRPLASVAAWTLWRLLETD